MARLKLRYIAPREQRDGSIRPRFVPGPRERALGFDPEDLKHDDGRWFSLDETKAWADARHAAIVAARGRGKPVKLAAPPRAKKTVEDLLEDFLKSGRFNTPRAEGGYASRTAQDYREKADVIIFRPQTAAERKAKAPRAREPFALEPAAAILPEHISNDDAGGFFEYLRRTRGLATARGAVMVLSAAYKWGRKASAWRLTDNPCHKLGLAKPRPQPIVYEIEEIAALIADADAHGEPELGDAVLLALCSGQRPEDVLDYDGAGTSDGVTRLVQSKRNRRVQVPALPPLIARLEAMQRRREAAGYICKQLIVDSHTGRGFNASTFQKRFRALRGRVAVRLPAIAGKQFKHLRKTMLTWIKRAGAGDHQFAAVSGHSLASLPQVMPHYYAPGAAEAAEAMTLVWTWMQAKGMQL